MLQLRHREKFGLCRFSLSDTYQFLWFRDMPEKLRLKPGGGNGAEGMGKIRLASQKLNPAYKTGVKSPS